MLKRCLFGGLLVAGLFTIAPAAQAEETQAPSANVTAVAPNGNAGVAVQNRAAYRATIRSMPLLERPDRFGHFYGNTVRRLHRMGFGAR